MALVDMYMKLEGIEGESKDKGHEKEIDVLSFSWGATQAGTSGYGGGGGAGKVNVHDLSFTKHVDKSSSALFLHCCQGIHIKEAKLTVRKAGGEPLEYLKITLNDCLVTGFQEGGAEAGTDLPTENISLNFGKIQYEYQEQSKTGGKEGGAAKVGWDLKKNVKV
jgi:type VI secretion system secreted protein Hcp